MTSYLKWNHFEAKSTWHESQDFYGNAYHIGKKTIMGVIVFICMVTPFTNWLIPLLPKIIKTGITLRWT